MTTFHQVNCKINSGYYFKARSKWQILRFGNSRKKNSAKYFRLIFFRNLELKVLKILRDNEFSNFLEKVVWKRWDLPRENRYQILQAFKSGRLLQRLLFSQFNENKLVNWFTNQISWLANIIMMETFVNIKKNSRKKLWC